MVLWSTQPLTEMSTRNVSWGVTRPVRMADNLTTFMCWLSRNLGASTCWNPLGLSRAVMGLLYLFTSRFLLHLLPCRTRIHRYIQNGMSQGWPKSIRHTPEYYALVCRSNELNPSLSEAN
jgi:hypothetical protein